MGKRSYVLEYRGGSACLKNLSITLYELSCKFITSPRMWRGSGLMVNGQLCGQKNLISLVDFRYSFRGVFHYSTYLRKAASGLFLCTAGRGYSQRGAQSRRGDTSILEYCSLCFHASTCAAASK